MTDRITKLQELLKATPDDSFLQHAMALEFIKKGDDEQAETLFKSILQREPAYVGSYYHLAKLLERKQKEEEAIRVYEKGMAQAQLANDQHALNELRMALEELED